jgi:hypothetical protein
MRETTHLLLGSIARRRALSMNVDSNLTRIVHATTGGEHSSRQLGATWTAGKTRSRPGLGEPLPPRSCRRETRLIMASLLTPHRGRRPIVNAANLQTHRV